MNYNPPPLQMSKDLATFCLHNLLQEFYYLNDRILFGDMTEKAVLKKAKEILADEQKHLATLAGCTDAWLDAHIAYGGFLALSYRVTWQDGEVQKGYAMPVRK
jgi:hypothetical protein